MSFFVILEKSTTGYRMPEGIDEDPDYNCQEIRGEYPTYERAKADRDDIADEIDFMPYETTHFRRGYADTHSKLYVMGSAKAHDIHHHSLFDEWTQPKCPNCGEHRWSDHFICDTCIEAGVDEQMFNFLNDDRGPFAILERTVGDKTVSYKIVQEYPSQEEALANKPKSCKYFVQRLTDVARSMPDLVKEWYEGTDICPLPA